MAAPAVRKILIYRNSMAVVKIFQEGKTLRHLPKTLEHI
jgi:hypothetical protein